MVQEKRRENLKNKGLKTTVKNIVKTWFVKGEDAEYFNICVKVGMQTSIEAADESLVAMKNWNGVDTLKSIKNETLIVWGDKDKSYNLNQVQTLKENIPNSSLKIIKGCAHNVHLENPEEFNKIVLNYLNK